jgi:predicted AAA+ superfamily ATPase
MNLISTLFYYSNLFQSSKVPIYKRSIYHKINFSHKLIGLKGAKGVGKTTLLHQYLNSLEFDISEKLYISMDNPLIGATRLLSIAEEFQKRGIKVLVVDEIHYQRDFEKDLKTIYDFFDIQVVFSGSSAIALSNADLSRRALIYNIPILSFREFLELKLDIELKAFNLEQILESHIKYAFELISKLKPLKYFDEYLNCGVYPFFFGRW